MNRNSRLLIQQISRDTNIKKYKNESEESFISRLIYSVISFNIRLSVLDKRPFEVEEFKSKKYILQKGEEYLKSFTNIYPQINKWFMCEEKSPIVLIRDRLEDIGELVPVGFDTDLGVPNFQSVNISNEYKVFRGIYKAKRLEFSGVTQLESHFKQEFDISQVNEFYNYNVELIRCRYVKYLKSNMKKIESIGHMEIFNKYGVGNLYNSWGEKINLNEGDVTIYKYNDFDYGFITKKNSDYFGISINNYDIENYEVRRYLLWLRDDCNNNVIAYKRKIDSGYVLLNLTCGLPKKELNIFYGLGWPYKSISDDKSFIFKIEVWDYIEAILSELKIKVVEELYE